jgi:hypothetical protein
MITQKVGLILFAAGPGRTSIEQLVGRARLAATRDLVEMALACPLVERVVVATGAPELVEQLPADSRLAVELDPPGEPFHFGQRLAAIIDRYCIRWPLYFGGGSAPLLAPESLHELCEDLLAATGRVIANNLRSADFFGFSPPEAIYRIALPADQDNTVPYLLSRQAGLRAEALEPAIENCFDLDTPADLMVLRLLEQTKRHLRRYLDDVALDAGRVEAVLPQLVSAAADVALIGRVDTAIWGAASPDSPAVKRLYVEERSLKALGRDARGEVRSLIGCLFEAVGPAALFASLASLATAVFFDTRVLFHHLRLQLSAHDRYASDLGEVDAIRDPTAREFTAAALACPVPVILGGRNVVAGGLWALTQEAWNRVDAGLLAAASPAAPARQPPLV